VPKYFFLSAFVAGLALAVYSMLHGVERSNRARPRPSAIFNQPSLAVLTIFFGGTGYVLFTRTQLRITWTLLIAAIVAVGVMTLSAAVMARWALPHYGTVNDEELTQGSLARVTKAISSRERGQIELLRDGNRELLVAESITGFEIPPDTDVVIETIQGGVARVEPWSSVEDRL
jgi:hypothetical protein